MGNMSTQKAFYQGIGIPPNIQLQLLTYMKETILFAIFQIHVHVDLFEALQNFMEK